MQVGRHGGSCGELLSTAPPMATNLSRVKYHSGRMGGGSCPHFRHTTQIILWLVSSRGSQVSGWFAKVSPDNVKLNKVNFQGVDKRLGSWMIGGGVR